MVDGTIHYNIFFKGRKYSLLSYCDNELINIPYYCQLFYIDGIRLVFEGESIERYYVRE